MHISCGGVDSGLAAEAGFIVLLGEVEVAMEVSLGVGMAFVLGVVDKLDLFGFDIVEGKDTTVVRWAMSAGMWAVGDACGRVSSRRGMSRIWTRERAVGERLRRYCGELTCQHRMH